MKKTTAVRRYGNQRKLARILGVSDSLVSRWGDDVPELYTYRLKDIERKARARKARKAVKS